MSSPIERRSPFLRLLDAFLQEENIKWMLGLGVCLLLSSSLRLVTLHWSEYTPAWKYLILLGYTGVVFGLGEFGYHRMGLRKTGTFLMSLTVLLIPISFLALHWVQPRADATFVDLLRPTGLTVLLGLNLACSAFAASRIFRHFLRTAQPTFLVSYLTLCLAGAIVPGLPKSWSLGLTVLLWAVFTAGTVKVNRHVFWLTEEHRLPRVFGFFPILLLGSQFAAVFCLGLVGNFAIPWLGLLCALVSLPILLTADAVAQVFQQRTGDLVRPLPWPISGPLALGTLLSLSGVILSMTGFPASTAVVPTATIAAVTMALVARRTSNAAFVWCMVICIAVMYQTSPIFFKDLVLQIRDQAASAVRESRLPYAFYGVTYAPLIALFSVASVLLNRRGGTLFATPLRTTATVLPCLLLGVSFTHPSAILPVNLLLCLIFAGQTVLFRRRSYAIPACLALLAAAYGVPQFALRVLVLEFSREASLMFWLAASGLLLIPGAKCDHWLRTLKGCTDASLPGSVDVCQFFSLISSIVGAIVWTFSISPGLTGTQFNTGWLAGIVIAFLLAVHALRWLTPGLGELSVTFMTYAGMAWWTQGKWFTLNDVDALCLLLLAQWSLSYVLAARPATRLSRAFGPATYRVSLCGLSAMLWLFAVQWMGQHVSHESLMRPTGILMLVWSLDAARRSGNVSLSGIAWTLVFVFVSSSLSAWMGPTAAAPWWMLTWAVTGVTLLAIYHSAAPRSLGQAVDDMDTTATLNPWQIWMSPLAVLIPTVLLLIAAGSLSHLGWPQRSAGLLSLAGLLATQRTRSQENLFGLSLLLLNWHLLAATLAVTSGHSGFVVEIMPADLAAHQLPLACLAALSLLASESRRLRQWCASDELISVHQIMLLAVTLGILGAALHFSTVGVWTASQIACASFCWSILGVIALWKAIRTQHTSWVWWSQAALVASIAYFAMAGVLHVTVPGIEFAVLIAGVLLWMAGRGTESAGRLAILSQPLQLSGFWIPLLVLPIALVRQSHDPETLWAGVNSLPLLGAATFYFWQSMLRRQLGTAILSAVLLNIACALLWKDLRWTDPQLFLMPIGISILGLTELMKREIPGQHHDRLRYVGSLMILVSPVYHIVTGSWLHILTLMIASVLLALLAIGVRVRSLLYVSTAFLLADLVALVARGSVDEPNVLWIAGVVLGGLIIALGAVCENHRETLLARLRSLAAELEQWA